MKIPSNRIWTQTNEGDALGVLHSTRNITLETTGKARLSQKAITILTPDFPESNNINYGLSIVYYDDTYIIVSSDGTRTFDLEGTVATLAGTDPTASIYGDGIIFNGLLHVTSSTDLHSYNGSAWTNGLETNTGSVPHPMEIFDALTTFKLAIGNDNTVKLLDSSYNNSTAVLTLPSQYIVTTLAYSNSYLYVGTRNKNGGDAKIFIWDGNGNNANYEVPVSSNWVYSVKPYKGSVCAVTAAGELIYINGTTPERLAGFPIFYNPTVRWQGNTGGDIARVFNRGVITDGDTIYINVNAKVETDTNKEYLPGFESGIWVYSPNNGLYHRASTNYQDTYVKDATLAVSDDTITTTVAHKLKTGDSVMFTNISGLSLNTLTIYYVKVISTTEIKLALSRESLKAESYLEITGTPTVSDILLYTPNTEYYQYGRVSSGAIAKPTSQDSYFLNWSTPIIWAASAQTTDMVSTSFAVNILADSWNIGFLETQRIYSDNIEQSWKKFHSFIDGLKLDSEEVIVKYRVEEGYETQAILGTWLDTQTINFALNEAPFLKVGDEAMIVDGYGRGYSAHITEVNPSSSTMSVVLDESIGLANENMRVSFTNYKKSTVHTIEDEIKNYLTATIDKQAPWVQGKAELRGFGIAVNQFDLSNAVQKSGQ